MTERTSQSDAEFFQQRGFGLKIGFGERPALLVIDMLKAFTNPQMMLGANLDKEIEAIKPLLALAHERDIPVIFSTVIYSDADLKDAGIWALKQKGVVTLKGDSEGVKIDPRLDFHKTDSLLVKKYASCFFGTDLVSRLLSQRVDTLIDRKSTRLNSSHTVISYAVFCLKKKKKREHAISVHQKQKIKPVRHTNK